MIKRFDIIQAKENVSAVPRWVGENAFFGFLILLLAALLISSFVFYKYVFSARNTELPSGAVQTSFQEEILQEVLQTWEDRAVRFSAAGKEPIRNIFTPFQQPVEEEAEN
jgi:hypothetical protein